jgi:hypothetical protein
MIYHYPIPEWVFPLHSLTLEYLDGLRFDTEQAATLRAIGEYRGKQALFYAQAPEVLKGLRLRIRREVARGQSGRDRRRPKCRAFLESPQPSGCGSTTESMSSRN